MRRLGLLLVFVVLSSFAFGGVFYKTPSNTMIWEEDFSDNAHLDAYNSYIGTWSGGARNNGFVLWSWDGPVVDVVVDSVNSKVYTVGELNVYSYLSAAPFSDNAKFRYDVFVNKLSLGGAVVWPLSVITRTNTNESVLSWDDGNSRYPSACVDSSGNVYVVYSDYINSSWRLIIQKVSSSGAIQWGTALQDNYITNTCNYQARAVVYSGYVFVAYYLGNNIRIAKVDATTGSIVSDAAINTSSGVNYYPDIALGGDNYLYVVWLNNNSGLFNVMAQRIDPSNLSRVTWGGNTSDKVVNVYTNYGNYNYWYPGEETVSIDIDGYDLYVAFKLYHRGFGRSKVFLQKIDFSGSNFVKVWTNGVSNDVMVGNGTGLGTYNADAYPDIEVVGDYVFVLWINHGPTENDHAFLQKVDKITGQMLFSKDINLRNATGVVGHHARISTDGAFLYVISANPYRNLVKLDQFGNVVFNLSAEDKRAFNSLATFRSKNLVNYNSITGFVPTYAIVNASFSNLASNSEVKFILSPESNYTGASTNYITLTNGQGGSLVNQKGSVFLYLILDNKKNEGTNNIVLTNLKIEFTNYYFSDGMVGKLPSGTDMFGTDLIRSIDDYNNGQLVDDYVYNDGTNSASGFWYFINNGNDYTTSKNIRIRSDTGNSNWVVRYFLCTNDGSYWVTNQDITSTITGSGFMTNLYPYAGGNTNIVVIKVFLTPSTNLFSGDNFTVRGFVDTGLPNGDWVLSDVVGFRGIVSTAKPDLRISKDNTIYYGNNIVNSDGSDQTVEVRMNVGIEKKGYFYVKNMGGNDSIRIQGTGGDGWWKVEYFTNGQNITSSIVGGTFTINLLYGEEFGPIEIRFEPTNSSIPVNVPKNIIVKGVSQTDPTKEDVVKFIIRPVITKVELVVRKSNDLSWVGGQVFSQNYSQSISNRIDNGLTNFYEVSITNLGSYKEEIIVKTSNRSFATSWEVKYFFGANDITSAITNQGFVISNLSPSNEGSNIIVRVVSPSTYPTGANEVMGIFFEGIGDSDTNTVSKRDTVSIYDKLTSTKVDGIIVSSLYGSQGYNVISSDPDTQYLYSYVIDSSEYTVILSNPSPSDFEFNVRITNANPIQWKILVSNSSSDITALITNSYWTTPIIPSGGTYSLKVVVFSSNEDTGFGAALGDTNKVVVLVNSPLKSDVIDRLSIFVEKALPPDLLVKNTNESSYRGGNLFITDINLPDQLVYNSYQNTDSDYKEGLFRVRNLRPVPENFIIKVSEVHVDNAWDYSIYRYIGNNINNPDFSNPSDWSNITTYITNLGFTNSITNGSDVLYRISAKPISATNNNDTLALKFSVKGESTKWEDVGVYKIIYGVGIPDIYAYDGTGKGVRVTDYSVSITNTFDKALGDMVAIYVSNQNQNIGGVFTIKGEGNKEQWEIKYYSSSTNDITSLITGSGYNLSFSPSEVKYFYVKIKAIPNSTYSFGQATNFDLYVQNDQGNRDTLKIVSVITDKGIPDVYIDGGWSNVFESTPSSQILQIYVGKGDTITNYLYVGNWRSAEETNLLYVVPPSVADFSLKLEKLSNSVWYDVTSDATNVGTKHSLVLSNTNIMLRSIISVNSNTSLPWNSVQNVDIQLDSQGKLKVDKGRFRYILADMGNPDVYVVLGGSTNGYSIYETNATLQVQDIEIEKKVTNTIDVVLGNGRNKDETMKVWASGHSYSEFKLRYYISTNLVDWNDVTTYITNSGVDIGVFANSNIFLRVEALLTVNSTNVIDDVLETTVKLYSWAGVSNDNFKLRYVVKDKNRPDLFTQTVGSNVFYPIPQKITNLIEKGTTITQDIVIMNAKFDRTSDFVINGNSGQGDWDVKFILDGNDITSDITNSSGYYISNIPPLGTKNLEVIMTLSSSSSYTFESNYVVNLKLFSYTKLVKDEFDIVFKVDDKGKPDVILVDSDNNVYYPDIQTITNKVEEGETITNYFYIQNDRIDKPELITIKGSFDTNTNWSYQIMLNIGGTWTNIVNDFTNVGFVVSMLSGTTITGQVIYYLSNNSGIESGSINQITIEALSQGRLIKDKGVINILVVKPRPDLVVWPVSSGNPIAGGNVYEQDDIALSNSTGKGYVMFIQPAIYSIIVENDDLVDDMYVVKVYGDLSVSNKWQATVRNINEEDITLQISNGITNSIGGTNSIVYLLEVKMLDAYNVGIGESNVIYFKVMSLKNTNKVDFVKVITTRVESEVVGRVVEKVSSSPLSGATIDIYESRSGNLIKSIVSSNDGKFLVKLIPTTYKFVVKKDKYIKFEKEITIPEVLEHTLEDFALLRFNLKDDVFDAHSFPNPVNVGGKIRLLVNVPQKSKVKAFVMDMNGVILKRVVNDEDLEVGQYSFDWDLRADDGTILKQGIYLFVVNDGRETIIKRIMIK